MADDEDIAALVIDNGSGMCKGTMQICLNVWIDWKSFVSLLGQVTSYFVVFFSAV